MQQVAPELNMTRAVMNTMIQWFIDMEMSRRIHIIADARMFDVGILEPQVNGLYQIRLNIAANATKNFRYEEDFFSFNCGYQGQDAYVEVPYAAVLGFAVPTGENTESILPIPNYERELIGLQLRAELQEMFDKNQMQSPTGEPGPSGQQLPDGAYAVHAADVDEADMPTIQELMRRPPLSQRQTKPAAKEQPKPLLDFGDVGNGMITKPKPRRV